MDILGIFFQTHDRTSYIIKIVSEDGFVHDFHNGKILMTHFFFFFFQMKMCKCLNYPSGNFFYILFQMQIIDFNVLL